MNLSKFVGMHTLVTSAKLMCLIFQIFLKNLSSVNPTKLNGEELSQTRKIKHKDILTIIDRSFRFEFPPGSPFRTPVKVCNIFIATLKGNIFTSCNNIILCLNGMVLTPLHSSFSFNYCESAVWLAEGHFKSLSAKERIGRSNSTKCVIY